MSELVVPILEIFSSIILFLQFFLFLYNRTSQTCDSIVTPPAIRQLPNQKADLFRKMLSLILQIASALELKEFFLQVSKISNNSTYKVKFIEANYSCEILKNENSIDYIEWYKIFCGNVERASIPLVFSFLGHEYRKSNQDSIISSMAL